MKRESGTRTERLAVLTISLAAFMGSLDVTVVNISLPTISRYFDVSTSVVSWIVLAYLLVMSSFLLAFGKLGDLKGFKRVFLAGFGIFVAGSFLCGVSPSIELLIAFRVLQATGAAMLTAIGPAMVSVFLPPEIRGRALGIVGTFASLGIALGPPIGGFLTTYLSWRWIFFVNVPVGIFAIMAGRAVLPESRPSEQRRRFDLPGAGLIFLFLLSLIFVLNMGQELGWRSFSIVGGLLTCTLLGAAFLLRESRFSDPLLDLSLFGNRNFTFANVAVLLIMLVYGGAVFLFPFYLEYVKNLNTDIIGLILMIPSVATMIVASAAGSLSDRWGSRWICVAASVLSVLGFYLLSGLGVASSPAFIVVALIILGISLGMFLPPNSNLIMAQSPKDKEGIASSLMMTARNLGTVIGIAVFEMVFSQVAYSPGISDGVVHGIVGPEALTLGFHEAFIMGLGFCLLATVFSLAARDASRPETAPETALL